MKLLILLVYINIKLFHFALQSSNDPCQCSCADLPGRFLVIPCCQCYFNDCPCGYEIRESRYACKVCPTTTRPPSSGGWGCFPSAARATLRNGRSIAMSELQTADRVQTGKLLYLNYK